MSNLRVAMRIREPTVHEIVARFGGHTAAALGIDLDDGAQLGRWLVAVCLTGARVDEARWQRAFVQLDRAGLTDPGAIAKPTASPDLDSPDLSKGGEVSAELEAALLKAKLPDAERVAWKLIRVSAALVEHYAGSVDRLVSSADNLEELGGRLAALAPGFGAASVMRFLRPLRDRWVEASELPLHPSAHAAAVHLGLLDDDHDPDGAPGALRAAIGAPSPPAFRDLEAALERLGAWCRRNRTTTCPLEDSCPARTSQLNPD
ncbi:MAG: hypothetical protein AAEJ52_10745 [Myxococcota bacterium]